MPAADEAAARVHDLCTSDDRYRFYQLAKLQHEIFLPSLIQEAKAGDTDAVTGIAGISGTVAFEALLQLLENPSGRASFIRQLCQIVETTHESFVQAAASSSAMALGARVELWDAWCEVITDQDFMFNALGQLARGTLDLSSSGSGGSSNFTRDQRFAIRDAWRAFLAKNHYRLVRGERVPLDDPSVTLSLTGSDIDPGNPAIRMNLKDGSHWPPLALPKPGQAIIHIQ